MTIVGEINSITTTPTENIETLTDATTHEEVSNLAKLNLRNCQKILFSEVECIVSKNKRDYGGGIEGTFDILDASKLSSLKKLKKQKANLPVIAKLRVKCTDRRKGDIQATVLSPSEEPIATFGRNKRRALFVKDADTEIPVLLQDKTIFSILKPDKSGKQTEISLGKGNTKTSYKMWFPAWQTQTKWCLFSFLCFFPTFGLAAPIGFCCMLKVGVEHKIDKYENGEKVKELSHTKWDLVDFEGVSSSEDKFALLLLNAFRHADKLSDPPSNSDGGGGGE